MATNQNNQISPLVNRSAYDPNKLSIFPDLLQQVHPDVATQALQPPAALAGEGVTSQTGITVTTVAHGLYYNEENDELLVLQQGTGDAPPGFLLPKSDVPIPPPKEPEAERHNLNCSICSNQFIEPTATKCGHLFCWSCINRAYEEQKVCPFCGKRINKREDLLRIYFS